MSADPTTPWRWADDAGLSNSAQFERTIASVRRIAEDYAAHQTAALRAECLELRAERETLRATLIFLANTSDAVCWCHAPVCINQPGCELARRALATIGAPAPEAKTI